MIGTVAPFNAVAIVIAVPCSLRVKGVGYIITFPVHSAFGKTLCIAASDLLINPVLDR